VTNEEILGVAEILERATNRFNEQAARFRERSAAYDRLITDMNADHERKMAEHRAAFGARTEADAKIIEGLRADVEDLRNRLNLLGIKAAKQAGEALGMVEGEGLLCAAKRVVKERDALRAEVADLRGIFDMVHASLGIKRGDHIGKAIEALKAHTPKRSHPVAVGGYLRRLSGFNTTPAGEVARVLYVDCDGPATEYTVKRPNGQQGVWSESGCEPCGPPADHDTPEGKRTAEGAVEPKPGDVVRLVRVPTLKEYPHDSGCWEPNWGGIDDHMRVHYVGSNITGIRVVRAVFGLEWPVSCVEVVKGADK